MDAECNTCGKYFANENDTLYGAGDFCDSKCEDNYCG